MKTNKQILEQFIEHCDLVKDLEREIGSSKDIPSNEYLLLHKELLIATRAFYGFFEQSLKDVEKRVKEEIVAEIKEFSPNIYRQSYHQSYNEGKIDLANDLLNSIK